MQSKIEIPENCICPITKHLMLAPVLNIKTGKRYEGVAILDWIKRNGTDYVTEKPATINDLVPDYMTQYQVNELLDAIKQQLNEMSLAKKNNQYIPPLPAANRQVHEDIKALAFIMQSPYSFFQKAGLDASNKPNNDVAIIQDFDLKIEFIKHKYSFVAWEKRTHDNKFVSKPYTMDEINAFNTQFPSLSWALFFKPLYTDPDKYVFIFDLKKFQGHTWPCIYQIITFLNAKCHPAQFMGKPYNQNWEMNSQGNIALQAPIYVTVEGIEFQNNLIKALKELDKEYGISFSDNLLAVPTSTSTLCFFDSNFLCSKFLPMRGPENYETQDDNRRCFRMNNSNS